MTLPADIRNERRVITADPMDINKVIKEHYESKEFHRVSQATVLKKEQIGEL